MAPSQTRLAEFLNGLAEGGMAAISETETRLAINQITGPEADALLDLLESCGWSDLEVEDSGYSIQRAQVLFTTGTLRVTAAPPVLPSGVQAVVSREGFAALLDRAPSGNVVWVEGLERSIETHTVIYTPWNGSETFSASEPLPDPVKVVRLLGKNGPDPHLGRWLLRNPVADVSGAAAGPWRFRAGATLLKSLAQEIEPDGRLLFRGPPTTRFNVGSEESLMPRFFAALQTVSAWTYGNRREVDNRHGLLATEISRIAIRGGGAQDLASVLGPALESAKIAYNFGVTQQSRDSLKALGDLRKVVSDDTSKLSETTRTLAAAVIGAVFGNIGLIVARLTLPANAEFIGPAAICLGGVLTLYVASVIGSGCHFISVQRQLRNEWRDRLYVFLSNEDYKRLVSDPASRAEKAFYGAAVAGSFMALLLLVAVVYIATAETR